MARGEARQVAGGQIMRGFERLLRPLGFVPDALATIDVL